ncbi:hypothetical protein B9Z55_015874 [Caenorhabditis nigoni]|uniref:Saposin B-type domain-containing protein n=1 Tax=Caenorhabditis nigoni TaxID=1611254 RepID=A0A2G5UC88_9PELO|nr:hypothetical protein B9Z55_015874 [Caenorhabditis nigoni]
MRLLLLLPILYASLDPSECLTPGENCEMCQIVLRTVFGHFSANVPSRKKLVNQLKHECKRHFNECKRLQSPLPEDFFVNNADNSTYPLESTISDTTIQLGTVTTVIPTTTTAPNGQD